jgi:two-component system response regulator DevR
MPALSVGSSAFPADRPTVFLLDEHEVVRDGLRHLLLRAGIGVVGESGSVVDALIRVPLLRPAVLITEARLSDGSGLHACEQIRASDPLIRCVILTGATDEVALLAAMKAGVAGYLSKRIGSADLADKVRRVAAGETFFPPVLRPDSPATAPRHTDPRLTRLSAQERKILTLIAHGLSNREIAAELFLAEKTIRHYVSTVLAKLGFVRRTQAAIFLSDRPDRPAE